MHLASAFLAPLAFGAVASARFVMYYDQYHTSRPTNAADRAGIDHVVLAFVNSSEPGSWKPFVPVETMRSEYPNAKLMAAIGGWGDTQGFGATCKSKANMAKFAKDVKNLVDQYGLDGVDCDWEYPGGNGADYKQVPNSAKVGEIDCFPKLLATIRAAIGPSKILSIAVPAKKVDMIAYTKETGPKIWPSVNLVNLMAYDFMNRRDNETDHHTSVAEAKAMVKRYLDIGCPPEKMNLGIAFYAKYFQTQGDCSKTPLGCPIVPAENPDGSDAGTSGAYTFEAANMTPITNASSLPVSSDWTCGPQKGRCANSCCSQYGNCGTTPAHCGAGCQFAFGTGCTGPDVAGSWQTALKEGQADEKQGGQYFFDAKNKLFWTWDTLEFMDRKFKEVIEKYGLGGVMSWSLGEDTYDYSHIRKLGQFAMSYHPYKGDRDVEVEVDGEGAEAEVECDDDDAQSKRKRAHIRRGQAGAHHFRA